MKLLNVSFDKAVKGPDGTISCFHAAKPDYLIEVKGPFVVLSKGDRSTISPIANVAYATPEDEAKKK